MIIVHPKYIERVTLFDLMMEMWIQHEHIVWFTRTPQGVLRLTLRAPLPGDDTGGFQERATTDVVARHPTQDPGAGGSAVDPEAPLLPRNP